MCYSRPVGTKLVASAAGESKGGFTMPKNKFQEVIFTLMMVVVMVYAMVVYNIAIAQGGLSNHAFVLALGELPLMGAIAFLIEFVLVGNLVKMIAFGIIDPREEKGYVITLMISAITVTLMCPLMSLVATILFGTPGQELFSSWITTTAFNFPVALCWQIFFGGPVVRRIFGLLFKPELAGSQAG